MADKKMNLDFYAKVHTDVDGVKGVVETLRNQLNNLKLPANATKGFEKSLDGLAKEIQEFETIAAGGVNTLGDTKKLEASWKKIATLFDGIGIQIKDLGDTGAQIFPKEVLANITKANKALDDYKAKIEAVQKSQAYKAKSDARDEASSKADRASSQLQKKREALQAKEREFSASQKAWSENREADYKQQQAEIVKTTAALDEHNKKLKELQETRDKLNVQGVVTKEGKISTQHRKKEEAAVEKQKAAEAVFDQAEEELRAAKQKAIQANKKVNQKTLTGKILEEARNVDSSQIERANNERIAAEKEYQAALQETQAKEQEVELARKNLEQARSSAAELKEQTTRAKENSSAISTMQNETAGLEKSKRAAEEAAKSNENFKKSLEASETELKDLQIAVGTYEQSLTEAKAEVETLDAQMRQMELDGAKTEWQSLADTVKEFTGVDLSSTQGDVKEITRILENYSNEEIKKSPELLERLKNAAVGAKPPLTALKKEIDDNGAALRDMGRAEKDVENLRNRILDFFSVSNTIQIFKNAVRSAIETVKELDAVMTETAVVTDFSIGDMWDKLPQYSKQATALGTSIASLYEATTLYYQQGLNSTQAMGVGIETMKMARIANMDAAAATEAMTAALRGFNMEINELSATRISDVYSELAAITASDTEQIATAMSKTASIAASANMEFETTAALLAQIIETTQEAPETAGTAMKTIIARFTEVKELFSEGMLTGEDGEGEEININKIDAALKTVGISLKDFLNGTKGIDDIFLELASKWDDLDLATQRYIATTAAGSRQQSRFIAMMSNYDRTMELVSAANNSAGASQEQFNKTLESLDAKIQRLKNAWAEFTMGLANNEAIKGIVDLLTSLLQKVNSLADAFSGGNGLIKSFISLGIAIAGMSAGKSILDSFLRSMGSAFMNAPKDASLFTKIMLQLGGALPKTAGAFEKTTKASRTLGETFLLGGKNLLILIKALSKIGIVVALAVAFYKLAESIKAASKAGKFESLQKSVSELEESLTGAKTELSEISSSKSNLSKLEDTLSNLTEGTDEWKQALMNVNGQVLELIEKYPILMNYIKTGSNGEMTISEEGWETLNQKQTQIINSLTGLTFAKQAETRELANTLLSDEFLISSGLLAKQSILSNGDDEITRQEKEISRLELNFIDWVDSWMFKEVPWWLDNDDQPSTWAEAIYGPTFGKMANNLNEKYDGTANASRTHAFSNFSDKQIMDLAAGLQEAGVYAADGISSDEITAARQVYRNLGLDFDLGSGTFEDFIALVKEAGVEFDRLGQQALNNAIIEEQYARSFMRNAIQGDSDLSQLKNAESIINFLTEAGGYAKDLPTRISEEISNLESQYDGTAFTSGVYNGKTLKEAYVEAMGYFEDANGNVYSDASMTQGVSTKPEDMLQALATANITLKVQADAKQISTFLSTKTDEQQALFNNLFSSEGSDLTAKQVGTYYKDGKLNERAMLQGLGFNGMTSREKLDFLSSLGLADKNVSEDQVGFEVARGMRALTNLAEENLKIAEQRIKKERAETASRMATHNKEGWQSPEFNASMLMALETKFGEEFRYVIDNVISSLEGTGDQVLADKGYQLFQEAAMERSAEEVSELAAFINEVNWKNPIEAAHQLNQEVAAGVGLTAEYAEQVLKIDSSFLSASSQMQYYFNSDEFKEVSEELKEILETNEDITATDVQSLTGKYSTLNKMLKNTGMTATALAKTLDLIAKNKLNLNQITEPVLALLKNVDSLGNMVTETLDFIDNFDAGPDENKAAEFLKTGSDTILENLKKGAYGNSQNYSYLNALFPGWDDGLTAEQRIAEMTRLGNKMKANSENMLDMWSDVAKGQDIWGNKRELSAENQALGIEVQKIGKEIVMTGYEGKTTDQLVAWIADAYDVSTNMAKLMLTDFKNYSEDLAYELMNNDYTSGIAAAAEKLQTWDVYDPTNANANMFGYVQKKIISQSEITAMAEISGKTETDIVNDLGGETNLIITNFRKANGELEKTSEVLTDIAEKSGFKTSKEMLDSYNTKNGFDITNFQKNLGTWGLSEAEQRQVIEDTINARIGENDGKGITIEAVLPDGTVKSLQDVTSYDDYQMKFDAEWAKQQAQVYGQAVGEAISEMTLNVDQEDLKNSIITVVEEAGQATKLVIGLDEGALSQMGGTIQSTLDGTSPTVKVTGWYAGTSGIPAVINVPAQLDFSGSEGTGNGAVTGIPGNAKGTKNSPTSYDSLVSEEGPELIQKANGTAYLTGQNGPEIVHLDRGDTVYTAEETADIFKKRSHTIMTRFSGGSGVHAYGGVTGGSGGAASDDDEETWENGFDKLYNLVRKIDEELHQRERIERRYEKLLEDLNTSANKIISVSREELAQLERERMLQEQLISGRKYQIDQYQSENSDLTKYGNVVQNERGESVLRINWDLINSVTDTDEGGRIEDYISQLEEWFDSLQEAEEALWDIEDAVEEIKERGEEEYFELEDTIKEALQQSYQDEIDKLSQINDSINDTNSSLLDAIQKSIDKQRQDRDNQRTEDDLAEKQRRLLYLQQDTSGANAMEILQLQKEIEEGQEDYTDTLIDQKISELQEQNDEAAKQREQQITLLQTQLDYYIETGRIWNDVYALMDEGLDRDTGLVRGSRLEEILKSAEGYKGMSEIAKMEWMNDTNNMIAQALAYLEIGRQLEDIGTQVGSQIEFTTSDGRVLTGTVNGDGSVTASDGKTYNNVFQGYDGKYYAGENIADVEEPVVESPGAGSGGGSGSSGPQKKNNPYGTASDQGYYTARNGTMWSSGVKAIQWALNDMGYNAGSIDGGYGYATAQAVQRFQRAEGIQVDGDYGPQTREKMRLRGYKTGGLADFTGPAWLDGTKAHPELVLNARDTQNFIQLKDILASVMERSSSSHTSTENNGDITYDIDINVESIGSDYDVEQVANKVKSMIGENARYRNNNTVSLAR